VYKKPADLHRYLHIFKVDKRIPYLGDGMTLQGLHVEAVGLGGEDEEGNYGHVRTWIKR